MTMTKWLMAMAGAALLTAVPAQAGEAHVGLAKGDVLIRLRAIYVAPNERSGSILPALPGERVGVDDSVMPEIDFTYMLSDLIGAELVLATTNHSLRGRSGATGGIGKIGSTWVLPPTLTAQYHFNPHGHVRPYVGAGINYTIFWNENASDGLETAVGPTTIHMADSFGYAFQAGLDVDISKRVFLNFDIKYIDMQTTAYLNTTALGRQSVHVNIDPIVVGVGLGMRF
ncbi:hypothetical protein IP88_00330 [alpha proteobacterium AAP81b]|nr:hypothetical protein IP88_00330 [alpha proteobacterium AAP81b]